MKLIIFERDFAFNKVSFKKTEIECEGKGNKENPIIIDSSTLTPNSFYIKNNNMQFINFKNLDKNHISLEVCHNITIDNCKFNYLELYNSAYIKINNISVRKSCKLCYCQEILIQDSSINKMKLYQANSNIIKNCSFNKIKKTLSNGNKFELITILDNQINELKERNIINFISKWKLKSLLIFIPFYVISFFILLNIFEFKILIPVFIILVLSSILILYIPKIIEFKNQNKEDTISNIMEKLF
jgi:hypothetical protein